MSNFIILWEKTNRSRAKSIHNLCNGPESSLTDFKFIWDYSSNDILQASHWKKMNHGSKYLLAVHMSNLPKIQDTLQSVAQFNDAYPNIPVILYSGGTEDFSTTTDGNIIITIDGRTYKFSPPNPQSICIFPKKAGDDLSNVLNLKMALNVLAGTDNIEAFFNTIVPVELQPENSRQIDTFLQLAEQLYFPESLIDPEHLNATRIILEELKNTEEFMEEDIAYLNELLDKIEKTSIQAEDETTYLLLKNALNRLATQLLI